MISGIFIPGITERMFRDCPLEAIEKFRTKGEVIEIEYNPWIEEISGILKQMRTAESVSQLNAIQDLANRRIFELWTMRCEELKRGKNERPKNDRKDH